MGDTAQGRLEQPVVSVIIASFNYGRYLRQAIDSALTQTYKAIEVIVVNDGSTDDTDEIAQAYNGRIAYISQDNMGVVIARNRGAAMATGAYLCFLDADDYLSSNYIENMVNSLSLSGEIIAYAYPDLCFVYPNGNEMRVLPDYSLGRLAYENIVAISAVVRRETFKVVGGFAVEVNGRYGFEDWDLWLTLAERGYIGLHVKGTYLYQRQHGEGRNITGERNRRELVGKLKQRHQVLYKRPLILLSMYRHAALAKFFWYKKRLLQSTYAK